MFKYNNINYSNYSNNIDYKYNYKIYYFLLLHLLFLFSFSLILSFTSTSSVIASSGSGDGGSCGEYCDPCDQETVDKCNGFREYTGISYIDGLSFDHRTRLRCIFCTPRNFTYPTMEEIRKRDFTKIPSFFKRDFEMFPKDGSYHIVPDDVVESLKSHISCKDDTSRYIVKEAYTEKKNTENVVIPYCKKWIVGISDNYVQSTLDDGSVNKLNPNTDIKVFCKEIGESKHININNPDTIDNYINFNSSIKLYDGFVCRDGFKPYDNSSLPEKKGVCKATLRYKVGTRSDCIHFFEKHAGSCADKDKGNYDYRYECEQKGGIISCTYTPVEVVSCKARKTKKCEENKQSTINNIYSYCNIESTKSNLLLKEHECLKLESDLQYCKNSSGRTYASLCRYLIEDVNKCNKEKEKIQEQFEKELECKQKFLKEAVQNYDECIYNLKCCEGDIKTKYLGCYVDASTYSNEKIDDVVKYEINICQKPIFMDNVRDVGIEKIYDPNLVNQN